MTEIGDMTGELPAPQTADIAMPPGTISDNRVALDTRRLRARLWWRGQRSCY